MTREEAITRIKIHKSVHKMDEPRAMHISEALEMAIKALEQEPCEDAISRQAVIDAMYALCDTGETFKENPWRDNPHIDAITDAIYELPSVTPKGVTVTDFADKCRECGREKVLDKIRAEIEMYEADCRLQGGTDECEKCNSNVFGSIYRIIDKYRAESEENI